MEELLSGGCRFVFECVSKVQALAAMNHPLISSNNSQVFHSVGHGIVQDGKFRLVQ